jgi:mono/diheme cytochrome c family protein
MKKILIPICLFALALPALALATGEDDFNKNCAKCHGGNIRTNAMRARAMKVDIWKMYLPDSPMNKEEMAAVIENGRKKMPAFKEKLSKEQIEGIVDHVLSLKKRLPKQ